VRASSAARLREICEIAKSKNRPYDALLHVTGGRHSSYALYLCSRVYGMRVLTFTHDNGFLSREAYQRIDKLIRIFEVPHLYVREPLVPELTGIFLRKTGTICSPCELFSFNAYATIAREYSTPLTIVVTSSRTMAPPPKHVNPVDPWFFRNVMKDEAYEERLRCSFYGRNLVVGEGLARLAGRRRTVVLPDYVEWDEKRIFEVFEREFDFHFGEEHSHCWAAPIADYLYAKRCGNIHPTTAKYSLLVRSGRMSREEALESMNKIGVDVPPDVDRFLEVVGMTRREFEVASKRSPDPYVGKLSRLFNWSRGKLRRRAA
jgi:hypothetical protein